MRIQLAMHRFGLVACLLLAGSEAALAATVPLVPFGSTGWRYFVGTSEASSPINAWRTPSHNDTAWLTGQAPFFYEDSTGYSGATALTDMCDNYTCIFMRKAFDVTDPNAGILSHAAPLGVVALNDTDGDGFRNRDECMAGTDPRGGRSYLKVEAIGVTGGVVIRFNAVNSRTYSVQYRDSAGSGQWQILAGVPLVDAVSLATRPVEIVDAGAAGVGSRYYRLVTPGISR